MYNINTFLHYLVFVRGDQPISIDYGIICAK